MSGEFPVCELLNCAPGVFLLLCRHPVEILRQNKNAWHRELQQRRCDYILTMFGPFNQLMMRKECLERSPSITLALI